MKQKADVGVARSREAQRKHPGHGPWRGRRRSAAGWTVLELALALVSAGVLTMGAVALWREWNVHDRDLTAERWLSDVERSLWVYVDRYHRLPCVDGDGDGLEDRGTAGCAGPSNTGGLPYATLGVPALRTSPGERVRYGVWRGNSMDLTAPAVASVSDAAQDVDGSLDFLRRAFAAAKDTAAQNQPQIAGMGDDGPRPDCTSTDVRPAVVVQIQSGEAGTALCFSQGRQSALTAIGRYELLGRLAAQRQPW